MSLKAGRVGVNPKEVDNNGNIKGSTSGSYTKEEADTKFETKENIGGLQFRVEGDTAQYKIPNGEWANFNNGSGGVGFNIPDDNSIPITQSMVLQGGSWINVLEGSKYYIDNKVLYVDILFSCNNNFTTDAIIRIPVNEQTDYTSIKKVNLASMCVNEKGSLNQSYMSPSGSTYIDVRFNAGVNGVTFRMYGQMNLNN